MLKTVYESALEKYILRGSYDDGKLNYVKATKAVYCAWKILENKPPQYLIYKLSELYAGFINIANPGLLVYMIGELSTDPSNKKEIFKRIAKVIFEMCLSPKSRTVHNIVMLYMEENPMDVPFKPVFMVKHANIHEKSIPYVNTFISMFYINLLHQAIYKAKEGYMTLENYLIQLNVVNTFIKDQIKNELGYNVEINSKSKFVAHYDKIKGSLKDEKKIKLLEILKVLIEWSNTVSSGYKRQLFTTIRKFKNSKPVMKVLFNMILLKKNINRLLIHLRHYYKLINKEFDNNLLFHKDIKKSTKTIKVKFRKIMKTMKSKDVYEMMLIFNDITKLDVTKFLKENGKYMYSSLQKLNEVDNYFVDVVINGEKYKHPIYYIWNFLINISNDLPKINTHVKLLMKQYTDQKNRKLPNSDYFLVCAILLLTWYKPRGLSTQKTSTDKRKVNVKTKGFFYFKSSFRDLDEISMRYREILLITNTDDGNPQDLDLDEIEYPNKNELKSFGRKFNELANIIWKIDKKELKFKRIYELFILINDLNDRLNIISDKMTEETKELKIVLDILLIVGVITLTKFNILLEYLIDNVQKIEPDEVEIINEYIYDYKTAHRRGRYKTIIDYFDDINTFNLIHNEYWEELKRRQTINFLKRFYKKVIEKQMTKYKDEIDISRLGLLPEKSKIEEIYRDVTKKKKQMTDIQRVLVKNFKRLSKEVKIKKLERSFVETKILNVRKVALEKERANKILKSLRNLTDEKTIILKSIAQSIFYENVGKFDPKEVDIYTPVIEASKQILETLNKIDAKHKPTKMHYPQEHLTKILEKRYGKKLEKILEAEPEVESEADLEVESEEESEETEEESEETEEESEETEDESEDEDIEMSDDESVSQTLEEEYIIKLINDLSNWDEDAIADRDFGHFVIQFTYEFVEPEYNIYYKENMDAYFDLVYSVFKGASKDKMRLRVKKFLEKHSNFHKKVEEYKKQLFKELDEEKNRLKAEIENVNQKSANKLPKSFWRLGEEKMSSILTNAAMEPSTTNGILVSKFVKENTGMLMLEKLRRYNQLKMKRSEMNRKAKYVYFNNFLNENDKDMMEKILRVNRKTFAMITEREQRKLVGEFKELQDMLKFHIDRTKRVKKFKESYAFAKFPLLFKELYDYAQDMYAVITWGETDNKRKIEKEKARARNDFFNLISEFTKKKIDDEGRMISELHDLVKETLTKIDTDDEDLTVKIINSQVYDEINNEKTLFVPKDEGDDDEEEEGEEEEDVEEFDFSYEEAREKDFVDYDKLSADPEESIIKLTKLVSLKKYKIQDVKHNILKEIKDIDSEDKLIKKIEKIDKEIDKLNKRLSEDELKYETAQLFAQKYMFIESEIKTLMS